MRAKQFRRQQDPVVCVNASLGLSAGGFGLYPSASARDQRLGGPIYAAFDVRIIFSQAAVNLAAFIAGLPLVIRPIKVAFESHALIELEQAARICGASAVKTFFTVTLPVVRNAVLAAFLLGTARASGEVGITMMIGGNVADRTNTLSLEIYNAVGRGDFDAATFLCLILAGVALILYLLLELLRQKTTF